MRVVNIYSYLYIYIYIVQFYPTTNNSNGVSSVGWCLWALMFTTLYAIDINQWLLYPRALCLTQR